MLLLYYYYEFNNYYYCTINNTIITHKLLNTPLLKPPFVNSRSPRPPRRRSPSLFYWFQRRTDTYIYIYIYTRTRNICIYIYIYTHMYTHTHLYVFIHNIVQVNIEIHTRCISQALRFSLTSASRQDKQHQLFRKLSDV